MKTYFPIETLKNFDTPFYYYNTELLKKTVEAAKEACKKFDYTLHYAVKANSNPKILQHIAQLNLGADCVSGGEIKACLKAGFKADTIGFAGVGKRDDEMELGLNSGIAHFHVESIPELIVLNEIAGKMQRRAPIAIRINPNIDAHTHQAITTGRKDNKFGITKGILPELFQILPTLKQIDFKGLHFHIGSQIIEQKPIIELCQAANHFVELFEKQGFICNYLNLGGGLGVDYNSPDKNNIPNFEQFFGIFNQHLHRHKGQEIHFEPGRSLVAQSGFLITQVLFVKRAETRKFIILDAGMTELLRPALYQSIHEIENLTSSQAKNIYDIVGPICESTDAFARDYLISEPKRGDLLVIKTAGAYGESMHLAYNSRAIVVDSHFSDELQIF